MLSVIRRIIGFVPALNPMFTAWFLMSPMPATSEVYRTPLYRPSEVPWGIWLWLALSIVSGVLLCVKKTIPAGLAVGIVSHIVITVCALITDIDMTAAFFPGAMIFFYILYAIIYYIYHREVNKP